MTKQFQNELMDNSASFMCSKWIFDRVPFVFNDDRVEFIKWKETFGQKLGIDSKSIVLTGSASCGFSLNPNKNYKEFSIDSDIDLAVISELHFDIAWKTLRNLGTKRFDLNQKQKESLKDHVDRLIYWGTIATDKILEILPFGKEWSQHLLNMSNINPISERKINVRLYKDFDALRAYHVANLEKLKIRLFENETK